jgi:SAM-dependent methyltransferase
MLEPVGKRLHAEFGDIDIYVFDQLLKGRIEKGDRVLDAGCGGGRNVFYLMREGFGVWGVDQSPDAIAEIRRQAAAVAPGTEARFSVQPVERTSFADGEFDVVICSSVLHFAHDESHWWAMVREVWRVLRPGGLLFTRIASSIGQGDRVKPLGNGRYLMEDGNERFLVDEGLLMRATMELGGKLLDPIKTTVVQNTRSMTTWVVRKG